MGMDGYRQIKLREGGQKSNADLPTSRKVLVGREEKETRGGEEYGYLLISCRASSSRKHTYTIRRNVKVYCINSLAMKSL